MQAYINSCASQNIIKNRNINYYSSCSTFSTPENRIKKHDRYKKDNNIILSIVDSIFTRNFVTDSMYIYLESEYNPNKRTRVNLLGGWSSLNSIKITSVCYNELKLEFYEPFALEYIKEDNGYIYDNDDLEMYLYGETVKELKESFYEDLVVSWKLYVKCEEEELTDGAKELRKKLLNLIKEIHDGIQ